MIALQKDQSLTEYSNIKSRIKCPIIPLILMSIYMNPVHERRKLMDSLQRCNIVFSH